MDENRLRFGVGVLVIAAIGIGIILTFLFGAFPTVLNSEYTLQVWFPSAEGVSTNTPVFRDGFRIGRVSNIQLVSNFDDHPEGGVVLTLQMDDSHRLTHDYVPRIGNGSFITGDSKLEFVRAERAELVKLLDGNLDLIPQPYSDGEYFEHGKKSADPFSVIFGLEDDIRVTMESIRGAGESIEEAGQSVKVLVEDLRDVIGMTGSAGDQELAVNRRDRRRDSSSRYDLRRAQPSQVAMLTQFQSPPNDGPDGRPLGPPAPGERIQPRDQATIRELTGEAIRTLEEFQGAIRDVRSIVSDPNIRQNLESSIERVPVLIDSATETLGSVSETFESFQDVSDSFQRVGEQFEEVGRTADGTIKNVDKAVSVAVEKATKTLSSLEKTFENVEKFTDPLGERGSELVDQVLVSLANLDVAVREIQGVGKMINQSDGTIRKLFEDDELYYDVLRTVENIEMASAKLRPIMDDVRVFSDKIARDPRQLGVRGAINNRPSGLGLK